MLFTLACLPGPPEGGCALSFLCTGDALGLRAEWPPSLTDPSASTAVSVFAAAVTLPSVCLSSWHAETSLCLLFLFWGQRQAVVHTGCVCSRQWA